MLVLQEKLAFLENKYAFDRGSNVSVYFLIKIRPITLKKMRIESARVRGSNKDGRDVFLEDGKDSAAGIEFEVIPPDGNS